MGQSGGGLILGVAGRLIGGVVGGPIGAAVGGLAGGLIGSLIGGRQNKLSLPDISIMTSAYGRPIPFFYGTDRFPGMVIWQDQAQSHKRTVGKGIGGGQSTTTFSKSVAVAFAMGPATLMKLFADGRQIFDSTASNPFSAPGITFTMRVYTGTDTQLPDPIIQAWVRGRISPPEACPAYRGLCYVVFDSLDLSNFGNRFPQITGIWSSNATVETVFKTLAVSASDTGGYLYALPSGNQSSGLGVDWVRRQVYGVTSRFADSAQRIRVFDLQSGVQIQQVAIADIFVGANAFIPGEAVDGLAVGQGGYVYLFSQTARAIWTLDAGTLRVLRKIIVPQPDDDFFDADFIEKIVPFPVTGIEGTVEMILLHGLRFSTPRVVNPITGTVSGVLPLAHRGVSSATFAQVGNSDPLTGRVDIWIVNLEIGDTTPGHKTNGFHVYRVQLIGNDPSALTITGDFTEVGNWNAADFGVPGFNPASYLAPVLRYSPPDDSLLISLTNVGRVGKINFSTGLSVFPANAYYAWADDDYAQNDRGFVPMSVTPNIWSDFDTLTGEALLSPTTTPHGPAGWQVGSSSYTNAVVFQNADLSPNQLQVAYLRRTTGPEYPVADIITDLCSRVGITADMIDVSTVTQTVMGYTVSEAKSAGAALGDVLHCFQIDMVESDYLLKFIPRGQAVVATIAQADLASVDAQDPSHFWQEKRAQQEELPLQINIRFTDPALDYLSAATYAKRIAGPVPTVFSKRKQLVDLPIRANATEARAIAERWLYTLWAQRDTYETKTASKYLYLDPTDNVTVNLTNGDSYTVRLESTELAPDLSVHMTFASEDSSTYASPGTPGAIYGNPPLVITGAPFGTLLQWNTPLLRDEDDTGGTATRIYFAAGAYASGWTTGTLYRSTDGVTWEQFTTISQAASWGHSTTLLGDTVNKFSTDYVNTVTLALQTGSSPLSSVTYDEMLSGANAALLGQEIIQYRTVTDNGDGTVTLSGILRGRRGTEWATGLHSASDTFVSLIVGEIGGSSLTLPEIGVSEQWRLVPSGRFVDQVPSQNFTYTGDDLKPYAPVGQVRTPSGGDLMLGWTRRTRLDGYFLDGTDTAPLYEATEAYEAYVLASEAALETFDPTDSGTYVRAFTGLTSDSVTYTAAQMATDGFTPATDTLYLGVYQRSAAIGRGYLGFKALPAF